MNYFVAELMKIMNKAIQAYSNNFIFPQFPLEKKKKKRETKQSSACFVWKGL